MRCSNRSLAPLIAALLPVLFALTGCTTNPATGAKSFTLLSWEEEKQMGAQAAAGLAEQFGGEVGDTISSDYVREVGQKLLTGIEPGVPDLDWEFTLLNDDLINAFALPGGKVYITRGLAEKLENEAEMAGVLGHEIGHVTARHGNQRISKQIGFNAVLGAAAVVGDLLRLRGLDARIPISANMGRSACPRWRSAAMWSCSSTDATRNPRPTCSGSDTCPAPGTTRSRSNA